MIPGDTSNFVKRLAYGQEGECEIAAWLRVHGGYSVLPIYGGGPTNNKGPILNTSYGPLVAPDLFCFRSPELSTRDAIWIEAKTKTSFTWHRITGQWVTGINLRHYNDYLKLATISPFPIWLLFLQLGGVAKDTPAGKKSPTGLFGRELLYLSGHEHHRHSNWGTSGMVYWDRDTLRKLADLKDVQMSQASHQAVAGGVRT